MPGTEDARFRPDVARSREGEESGAPDAWAAGSGRRPLSERWVGDAAEREEIATLVRSSSTVSGAEGAGRALPILDDAALRRLGSASGLHEAVHEVARELQSVLPGMRARVLSLYLAGYVAHHLCAGCRDAIGLPAAGQRDVAPVDCARCAAVSIAEALCPLQRASLDGERAALARRMRQEHERSRTLIEQFKRPGAEAATIASGQRSVSPPGSERRLEEETDPVRSSWRGTSSSVTARAVHAEGVRLRIDAVVGA